MKKIISIFALLVLIALPVVVFAYEADPASTDTDGATVPADLELVQIITNIADYAYTLLLVAAVIAFVWAGFMFLTAQGEPEKLNKAKMMVVYSIIGVLVSALSWGIVGLIRGVVEKK